MSYMYLFHDLGLISGSDQIENYIFWRLRSQGCPDLSGCDRNRHHHFAICLREMSDVFTSVQWVIIITKNVEFACQSIYLYCNVSRKIYMHMVLRAFIMFRKTVITEVFETLLHDNLHQVHTHYSNLGPETFRSKESLMKKIKF